MPYNYGAWLFIKPTKDTWKCETLYIYIYIIYLFQICKFLLTPTLITVNPCGCYRLFDEDYDNFESGGNDYNDDNSGDAGDYWFIWWTWW